MYNYASVNADQLEYVSVADEGEIPPGQRLIIEVDGEAIAVFNIAGMYFAISDVSPDDGPVAEASYTSTRSSARHGGRFDVRTGKVLRLPAVVDIPAYPVRVQDGQIQIGLPAQA
jgi:3-phenylpropionate/trans-cinnamate dioxygenase ferredoxin subunit